jgi:hypothetical protein
MSFKSYLEARRVTRHPNGHFVLEARADREFPDADNWAAIRGYLATVRACEAAMKAGYAVWRGYRRQMRSGAFVGQA